MSAKNAATALANCRIWHRIDATNQVVGHLASRIATVLQGKHKPHYHPAADCGDWVVVENVERIRFTGSKWTDKKYYSHSGYPGHLKVLRAFQLAQRDPGAILRKAVSGMLPKNRVRRVRMTRLQISPGPAPSVYQANAPRSYVPLGFGVARFQ